MKYIKLNKISGPVSVCILKDSEKQIMLFGDYHFAESNVCMPCNKPDEKCLTIDNLFELLFTRTKRNVDFFIESPFVSKESDVEHIFEQEQRIGEIIGNLINKFGNCLVSKKSDECKKLYPTTRLHYIDLRYGEQYVEKLSIFYQLATTFCNDINVMQNNVKRVKFDNSLSFMYLEPSSTNIQKQFPTTLRIKENVKMLKILLSSRQNFSEYLKLFLESNNYHSDLELMFSKEVIKKIYPKNTTSTYKINNNNISSHRIKKQIDLIKNPNYRFLVTQYITDMFDTILGNYDFKVFENLTDYFDIPSQRKFLSTKNSEEIFNLLSKAREGMVNLQYIMFDFSVCLVDAYAISRMVKFYEKTDTIIAYAGDMHIGNYKKFFIEYLKLTIQHEITATDAKIYDNSEQYINVNRCMVAPKNKPFMIKL